MPVRLLSESVPVDCFFFVFLSCDVIKPNDSCGKMMQELEVKLSMVAHCNKSQHFEHLFLWVRDD